MEKRLFIPQESIPALLDGSKTRHRVVLNPQPTHHYDDNCDKPGYFDTGGNNWACERCGGEIEPFTGKGMHLPFRPGDLLWIPEPWAIADLIMKPEVNRENMKNGNDVWFYNGKFKPSMKDHVVYRFDYHKEAYTGAWHSPVTMPMSAARIWLEVLGTRVERLQEITEEDAGKEGVNFCCPSYRHAGWNDRWISGYCHDCKHHDPMTGKRPTCYFRHGYEEESRFQWWCGCSSGSFTLRDDNISEPSRFKYAFVWDELRRKVKAIGPAYWQSNPYVEVLEFRRVER